jgi:hypothetical protein
MFPVRSVPRLYTEEERTKIFAMDLEESVGRNDCAGEGQQQFNRQIDRPMTEQFVRDKPTLSSGRILL